MNKMTTFYIVRHGQTEWNVDRIVQGHKDSELTASGRAQAKDVAEKFKEIQIDHVFSSDLLRARQTAEILTLEKKMAIKTTKLLREQTYGEYEGKDLDELLALFKHWDTLSEKERFTYRAHHSFETDEESTARFITFLRETAVAYANQTILVVTHGIMMRNLMIHLGSMSYKDNKFFQNSGHIILESDGVDFFVKEMNGFENKPKV